MKFKEVKDSGGGNIGFKIKYAKTSINEIGNKTKTLVVNKLLNVQQSNVVKISDAGDKLINNITLNDIKLIKDLPNSWF